MSRFATALVHHPCVDKNGDVYTTSITNLDVHDIARSSRTYDAAAFYIVTPVTAQQDLAGAIAGFWETSARGKKVPSRAEAMRLVCVVPTLEDAIAKEREACGAPPLVISTSARDDDPAAQSATTLREKMEAAPGSLVVFGTGYGLAEAALALTDVRMLPVLGPGAYNHLSVRSAAAIVLDRLRSPNR